MRLCFPWHHIFCKISLYDDLSDHDRARRVSDIIKITIVNFAIVRTRSMDDRISSCILWYFLVATVRCCTTVGHPGAFRIVLDMAAYRTHHVFLRSEKDVRPSNAVAILHCRLSHDCRWSTSKQATSLVEISSMYACKKYWMQTLLLLVKDSLLTTMPYLRSRNGRLRRD